MIVDYEGNEIDTDNIDEIISRYGKDLKEGERVQIGRVTACSCGRLHPVYLVLTFDREYKISMDTGWY